MRDLPSGTVTFLFTDIKGSTLRWERDAVAMRDVLARHDALMRDAIAEHRGVVFKTVGDAFYAAFSDAPAALRAALAAQRALFAGEWGDDPLRVQMAIHTGSVEAQGGDYNGRPLYHLARLLSAGHGGQTLVSGVTEELIRDHLPSDVALRDMGEARLKDLLRSEHIYQVVAPDLPTDFPPLRTLDMQRTNLPALARADQLAAHLSTIYDPTTIYPVGLTAREVEVLRLVAAGHTNRQIADALSLSPRTIDVHIRNIFAKTRTENRAGATAFAFRHDLA